MANKKVAVRLLVTGSTFSYATASQPARKLKASIAVGSTSRRLIGDEGRSARVQQDAGRNKTALTWIYPRKAAYSMRGAPWNARDSADARGSARLGSQRLETRKVKGIARVIELAGTPCVSSGRWLKLPLACHESYRFEPA